MRDKQQPPDLSSLGGDFEIVGELGSNSSARTYMATRKDATAKRKDDETGVLIEVVTPPEGDEANALSHLAADTQLLTRLRHRRLVPVLEGRWIGTDAFAVVTPRIGDPSLAQALEKGEPFSSPRTAAILREVNGLLAWAREQKIVHRNVTPDRIYLEPKTDRVRVSFAVAPIPRIQQADKADADARTIGRLAMAMLTGSPDPISSADESLGDLRPDLPEQLLQATAELLGGKTSGIDVAAYIALVGMAEPLFAGETEAERIRDEVLEEQRVEREKLATERADFERTMEEERRKLSMEREELQRKVAGELEALQRKDAEERAALTARREELEAEAADRRAALERAAEQDRQQLAALRAAIAKAGELEVEKKRVTALDEITDAESALDQGALATPPLVLPINAPLQPLTFEPLAFAPLTFAPLTSGDDSPDLLDSIDSPDPIDEGPNRRKWILPGVLGAAAIAIVAVLFIAGRPTWGTLDGKPAAGPIVPAVARTTPPPALPAVPLPAVPSTDSSSGAVASTRDSGAVMTPVAVPVAAPVTLPVVVRRRPRPVVREVEVRSDTFVRRDTAATSVHDILSRVPGAAPLREVPAPRDSGTRPDTAPVPPTLPPA